VALFLEGRADSALSNITGEGFDKFLESLWDLVKAIKPKRTDGVFSDAAGTSLLPCKAMEQ